MEVIEKSRFCVAGVQVRGSRDELRIKMPLVWKHFLGEFGTADDLHPAKYVAVSLDSQGDYLLQLVGMVIPRNQKVPNGLKCVEIPAQRYIYFEHQGCLNGVGQSFEHMYEWAADQGLQAGEFKVDFGYSAASEESVHYLHIGLFPPKPWRYIVT